MFCAILVNPAWILLLTYFMILAKYYLLFNSYAAAVRFGWFMRFMRVDLL